MSWFDFVGLCLGFGIILLASVCTLGAGLGGMSPFHVCQLCCKLTILQFALFMVGWLVGIEATSHMAGWVPWANAMLLASVAVRAFGMRGAGRGHGETSGVDEAVRLLRVSSGVKMIVLIWGFVFASMVTRACSMGLMGGAIASVLTGVGILAGYRLGIQVGCGAEWVGACILLLVVVCNFLSPA